CVGGDAPFDTSQCISPSDLGLVEPVGDPQLHAISVWLSQRAGPAVLTNVLGIVADQAVTLAGGAGLHFARGRELEALFDAALGLQFRHLILVWIGARAETHAKRGRHGMPYRPGHPRRRG